MGHFGMSEQEATLLHATRPNVTNTTTTPSRRSQIASSTRATTKTKLRPARRLLRTRNRRPEQVVATRHPSRMRSRTSSTTRGPSCSTRNRTDWGSLCMAVCLALHLATSPSSQMLANGKFPFCLLCGDHAIRSVCTRVRRPRPRLVRPAAGECN